MGLRVNTNIASLTAQRNLGQVSTRLQGNFSRLSSGLRIVRAVDDAGQCAAAGAKNMVDCPSAPLVDGTVDRTPCEIVLTFAHELDACAFVEADADAGTSTGTSTETTTATPTDTADASD